MNPMNTSGAMIPSENQFNQMGITFGASQIQQQRQVPPPLGVIMDTMHPNQAPYPMPVLNSNQLPSPGVFNQTNIMTMN